MNKKLIIILSIVLVVVLIAVAAVWYFSRKRAAIAPPENGVPAESEEVIQVERKIFLLSPEPVVSPTLAMDGKKVKYYTQSSGNVFEVNFDGSNTAKISSIPISGILKAKWSSSKEQTIVTVADLTGVKKIFFDYQNKKTFTYNKNIKDIVFSPDGEKITYQFIDDSQGANNISTANPDSSDWNTVFDTRLRDLRLNWITSSKIALTPPSSGLVENAVYTLNPSNGNFGKVLSGTNGLSVQWSPSGNSFIYSATDSRGKNLSLNFTEENGEPRDLGFKTFAEKCVFSQTSQYVICAVPARLSEDAILPDDYYKNKITTNDEIWKIDTDGTYSAMLFGAEDLEGRLFDMQDLILTPEEDYIIFVNKKDGMLYSIKLY